MADFLSRLEAGDLAEDVQGVGIPDDLPDADLFAIIVQPADWYEEMLSLLQTGLFPVGVTREISAKGLRFKVGIFR